MSTNSKINQGSHERSRDAIDKQVRLEFERELAATTEYWARVTVEKKITDEIERRMKEVESRSDSPLPEEDPKIILITICMMIAGQVAGYSAYRWILWCLILLLYFILVRKFTRSRGSA